MPKWICENCGNEFWGWSAYYTRKSGHDTHCPECEGSLVEKGERKKGGLVATLLAFSGN